MGLVGQVVGHQSPVLPCQVGVLEVHILLVRKLESGRANPFNLT